MKNNVVANRFLVILIQYIEQSMFKIEMIEICIPP